MHFSINLFDLVQVFVIKMIFGITKFKFFIDVNRNDLQRNSALHNSGRRIEPVR